jgi:hypothetical protein
VSASGHATALPGWLEVALPAPGREAASSVFFAARRLTSSAAWIVLSPPRLVVDGDQPRLSLTILLAREPRAGEQTIRPLVTGGLFNASVTAAATAADRTELGRRLGGPVSGAFARTAVAEWVDSEGRSVVQAPAHGLDPTGVLSASLDAEHTMALADALAGVSGGGVVRMALRLPTQTPMTRVRLELDPAEVVEALRARATGEPPSVAVGEAEAALAELLLAGKIGGAADQPTPVVAALAAQLRARLGDVLEPDLADRSTLLVSAGPTALGRELALEIPAARGVQDLVLERDLVDLVEPALGNRDRLVRLFAPDVAGTLQPVPPRTHGTRARALGPIRLAERGGRAVAIPLAVTPDLGRKPLASQLVASDMVQPLARKGRVDWVLANDLVVPSNGEPVPGGPEVHDPAAPTYPDHANPAASWAAPQFTLVPAQANADPQTSPFLYSFSQVGMTGPGSLKPGLDASIRMTVASVAPAGGAPIAGAETSALLMIPFRDAGTGATALQTVAGEITPSGGNLRVDVRVADDTARLAYGALAYPGFQAQPAQLKLATSFRAWVPLPPGRVEFASGGKIATLELGPEQTRRPPEIENPRFDPATFEIEQQGLRFRLVPDGNPAPRVRDVVRFSRSRSVRESELLEAIGRRPHSALMIRPGLATDPERHGRLPSFALQTIVREQTLDVLFPCSELGGLYRQRTDQGEQAVGCQDVLKLGEIHYRLYEELTALRTDAYHVHRSLTQPGRFLLLPTRYRITRYGPGEPTDRAYRPAAMLYGLLQPDPTQNRYYLTATLEPDVAPFQRAALIESLRPLSPAGLQPVLDLPTDPVCAASRSYQWVLPGGFATPEVLQIQDGFQVSVSIGLDDALLLTQLIEHSGLHGSVTFALPDATSLTSELTLDTIVTGPLAQGPVTLRSTGAGTEVGNPTERAIDVLELRDGATVVPVNQTLASGGKTTVPTPTGAAAVAVFTAHADPMTLAQIGVFVEDVTADVAFVNLISFANHDLVGLEVNARLQGQNEVYTAALAEGQTATRKLTLPLDSYLQGQVLLYQVAATLVHAAPFVTAWQSWDLAKQGCVISLTWDAIAPPGNPT